MNPFRPYPTLIGAIVLSYLLTPVINTNLMASAQIIPDGSLQGQVTQSGNVFEITGGGRAGNNLFYSFEQFSIPTGTEAFFKDTSTVENIFSRITGRAISNIDGVLRAEGTANLFLLNPNGIVFGSNASLQIGGSFLGSTASNINFADGIQFSATNLQAPSLLTVSVPVGLGFGSNPGAIRVQGTGHQLSVPSPFFTLIDRGINNSGLRVQPGNTLALIGGNVTLDGGTLTAEGGRIELGSVASGLVRLNSTSGGFTLGYEGVPSFQNIQLLQQALADASGVGSGSIQVQGASVTLTDGSVMLVQNQGNQPAGSINVKASESLELSGTTPDARIVSGLFNQTVGDGRAGDITVSTKRLIVRDGGVIDDSTYSAANGGNININATEFIQLVGISPLNATASSNIGASTSSSGDAGNITLFTQQLSVLKGGSITSLTFGSGDSGDVTVYASNSVDVRGLLATTTLSNGQDVKPGKAGNLEINTSRLVVQDGGRVDASTLAAGLAGSITVNASESVEVGGKVPGSVNPSLIISSANIVDDFIQQLVGLPPVPSGDSGNVTINTPHLSVTDGAQVTVRNDGTGKAGTLIINADSILLDNQGGITASTNAGESAQEGSITLNVRNSLQMRHNSLISATAGGDQRGGNIIINAGAIAAVPEEDSDITASAPGGTGGRITINTQGIFGFKATQEPTPTSSDITARGKKPEFNGTIQVNTPEINVQGALNQLNGNFITTEQAIASSCFARRNVEQGTFTVTGTGGLPTTPYDAIGGRYAVTQVQGLPNQTRQQASSPTPNPPSPPAQSWKLGDPIQEAQGMSVTPDGRIIVGTNPQLAAIADPQTLICHLTIRPKAEGRGQKG